jgi:endonuclease/exonuclease/phosphatase (EEP) superfamily protein YafD
MLDAPGPLDGDANQPSRDEQPSRHEQVARSTAQELLVAGWAIVIGLGVVALLRVLAWDFFEPFIVLNALTTVIYLPAWIIAIAAVIVRRWWLVAAALVIVAAQVVFMVPEFSAETPVPAWAEHAPVIRVFDANVDKNYGFDSGYVQAIEQDRPDLITLEEFTPTAFGSMQASGVLASYPYRCLYPAFGAVGFLVVSKWRLSGCELESVPWDGQQAPYMVEATLYSPGGPVALRVVHTLAPLPSSWTEWSAALAAASRSLRQGSDARVLMLGDFNATWGNAAFVQLLHDGLSDAAAARGDALEMSWPNGAVVPPFARIDHVLTGSRLAATSIAAEAGFGSDHRYLVATVAVNAVS